MPDPINLVAVLPYYLIAFCLAYILGSIPFGLVLTRMTGSGDIRKIGSGNIGATNVLRTGRKWLALATLVLDSGKGAVAVLIAGNFGPDITVIAASGAFLGHIFPVWLRFNGGKGVATAAGIICALDWPVGLMAAGTWLGVAALTRYSSLAAILTAILAPAYFWIAKEYQYAELCAVISALVLFRHRENIMRLVKGTESKIGGTAKP